MRRVGLWSLLCWGILPGGDFLLSEQRETVGAESSPAASSPSSSAPTPPAAQAPPSSKKDPHGADNQEQSTGQSPWLTELLREEFQRWLTSRSEALFNQLQTEFGQWLALRGSRQSTSAEDSNRPAWVDAPPGVFEGQYWQTIKAGPESSPKKCQEALRLEIQKAVVSYAAQRFGTPWVASIPWKIEPLLPEILAAQWLETRLIDYGPEIGRKPMFWLYARVRFTRPVQEEIARQYRQAVVEGRLRLLAEIGGGFLVGLALSYGVLRWQCNRLYPPKAS